MKLSPSCFVFERELAQAGPQSLLPLSSLPFSFYLIFYTSMQRDVHFFSACERGSLSFPISGRVEVYQTLDSLPRYSSSPPVSQAPPFSSLCICRLIRVFFPFVSSLYEGRAVFGWQKKIVVVPPSSLRSLSLLPRSPPALPSPLFSPGLGLFCLCHPTQSTDVLVAPRMRSCVPFQPSPLSLLMDSFIFSLSWSRVAKLSTPVAAPLMLPPR